MGEDWVRILPVYSASYLVFFSCVTYGSVAQQESGSVVCRAVHCQHCGTMASLATFNMTWMRWFGFHPNQPACIRVEAGLVAVGMRHVARY
jgi:hypothetical protein